MWNCVLWVSMTELKSAVLFLTKFQNYLVIYFVGLLYCRFFERSSRLPEWHQFVFVGAYKSVLHADQSLHVGGCFHLFLSACGTGPYLIETQKKPLFHRPIIYFLSPADIKGPPGHLKWQTNQ